MQNVLMRHIFMINKYSTLYQLIKNNNDKSIQMLNLLRIMKFTIFYRKFLDV